MSLTSLRSRLTPWLHFWSNLSHYSSFPISHFITLDSRLPHLHLHSWDWLDSDESEWAPRTPSSCRTETAPTSLSHRGPWSMCCDCKWVSVQWLLTCRSDAWPFWSSWVTPRSCPTRLALFRYEGVKGELPGDLNQGWEIPDGQLLWGGVWGLRSWLGVKTNTHNSKRLLIWIIVLVHVIYLRI